MRQIIIDVEDPEEVITWLENEAKKRHIYEGFKAKIIREENNWLHIAVHLENVGDISDRAVILQEIEDAWGEQKPRPYWQLMLRPS